MDPRTALLIVGAIVVVAAIVGVLLRRAGSRARTGGGDVVTPGEIDLERLGSDATIVQFSTEFCARCPGVRRALTALVAGDAGVAYADVDLTHEPDRARRFRVLQTPTVLVLDRDGRVDARFGGAVTPAAVRERLEALRGARDGAAV